MAVYTLPFCVTESGTTPAEVQSAGVFGDHLVTELVFTVPSVLNGCRYRLEITDGSGAYDITELLDAQNGEVRYVVPRKWTSAGVAHVRLIAVKIDKNGNEELCFHAQPAHLFFEERDDGEPITDILPAWQEVMTRAETVTDKVENAYVSGAFKGEKGDQGEVGPQGPQGEKGDPGSVSYETLTPEQKQELTAEGTALCAAVAAGVVTIEQNNQSSLQFWVGTQEEYDGIETKNNDCFYIISDDNTYEEIKALIASNTTATQTNETQIANNKAVITQLQTHLTEPLITVTDNDEAEAKLQDLFKKMPDATFARYYISTDGSYSVFELSKAVNGWGHMERINYGSRLLRTVRGSKDDNGVITYTFEPWIQFATM